MVAIGLLLFSCITASNFKNPFSLLNQNQITFLTRLIGVIFLIRAIGDFNIVGLFKQKNKSLFAIKDRQIFVPLCLYLGISSILITIL